MARAHWDAEVSGWISDFGPAAEQLRVHAERLSGLVGRRLTDGWSGWYAQSNRRCPDIPLVLVFENGDQLELNWEIRDDSLSLTWNTIDLSSPPTVFGRELTGFATVESPYFQGDDLDVSHEPPMHALAGWQVDGFWMAFGAKGLPVSSGVEGAALHSDLGTGEWRRSTS